MPLEELLRESCDSVHNYCAYSSGKKDKKRSILYVHANAPSCAPTKDRNCEFQEVKQHNVSNPVKISCTWSL